MKYKEMDGNQQDAFKGMLLNVLNVKSQEEQQYTQQFFRLLLLGNGSGILILTTLMGALVGNKDRVYLLRAPLVVFFVEVALGGLVYFPLVAVSGQATNYVFQQVTEFFLNKREIEQVTGYGFNRLGKIVVSLLLLGSLVSFGVGVLLAVSRLGRL